MRVKTVILGHRVDLPIELGIAVSCLRFGRSYGIQSRWNGTVVAGIRR